MSNQFHPDKVLFHTPRIEQILDGGTTFPSVYEISLIGYCNQKCTYCVSQNFRSRDALDLENARSVLNQIVALGGKAVTITGGGEPLLHPDFGRVLQHARSQKLSVGIITNGTYEGGDEKTIVENASFCRFSLDTVNPSEYERLRGTKHLELVLHNVRNLVEEKQRQASETLVGVQIVWVDQSFEQVEEMVAFFADFGVDFIQIRPVDNVPFFEGPKLQTPGNIGAFLNRLSLEYTKPGFNVISSAGKWAEVLQASVQKTYSGCVGANLTASIGHDFKVYFCCSHIGNPIFCLGDLRETSLEEILLSEKRMQLIENVDHEMCQVQCRNHELNKKISSLMMLAPTERIRIIDQTKNLTPPQHWEFL